MPKGLHPIHHTIKIDLILHILGIQNLRSELFKDAMFLSKEALQHLHQSNGVSREVTVANHGVADIKTNHGLPIVLIIRLCCIKR